LPSLYFLYPGDLDTPSGGYRYDRQLLTELRRSGLTVQEISLPQCLPTLDEQAESTIRRCFQQIPDGATVCVDGLAFGVLDEIAEAEQERLRLIALCHHPLALETGLDPKAQTALMKSERRALQCARAVLVTSPHTKDILIQQFGLAAETITVALPGTEPAKFAACDGSPPRLLTVASLTPRKGHDVLLTALSSLTSLPWQARFVGSDHFDRDWTGKLRKLADHYDLGKRVEFCGAVTDTAAEFQNADLFVLPSRYEGYGMVFAEALAAGLPIVASRGGAIPGVVPESAGILVGVNDSAALANALARLLKDRALRKRLQAGAQQAAANLTRWTDTAATVAEVIKGVA
jgi:glycosyltransferase involved in cell wall biosynthesis